MEYKKVTITLGQLSKIFSDINNYDEYYKEINSLVDEEILIPIKTSGDNGFLKPLSNKYKINKLKIEARKIDAINKKNISTLNEISLESYFTLPLEEFEKDMKYIDMIDAYIRCKGLPLKKLAPEISYEFTGNEKWIETGSGKQVLTRLGLWEKVVSLGVPDPIAFSINKKLLSNELHKHLIIENKSPYIHLMNIVNETIYNTIIYGQGWKITKGLELFKMQYPFGEKHEFYYFGDIDREGILIYNSLKEYFDIKPAKEFYEEFYDKKWSIGKNNQSYNSLAINSFVEDLKTFIEDERPLYIIEMLKNGYYQPQEYLTKIELEKISMGDNK